MKKFQIPGIVKEIFITLAVAVALALLIRVFILNTEVNMPSMQNTLIAGQRLLVVKFLGNLNPPHRGDIIILRPPIAPETEYVKRLIGLPGDTIEIKNGKVYLNSIALDEPYIKETPKYTYGPFTVPENNYFVLGDNRNNSADSHFGWTVTKENLTGKVWLRYWPFNKFGFIGSYPLDDQLKVK
jgi:signal peptidase I